IKIITLLVLMVILVTLLPAQSSDKIKQKYAGQRALIDRNTIEVEAEILKPDNSALLAHHPAGPREGSKRQYIESLKTSNRLLLK
ncbi:MAG: hypothetical protein K8S56_04900, partial [Candidatus Cloacimonetes bacterium]|nr:hypothetical protein [Candidatus Cloacimonadota bacterium]